MYYDFQQIVDFLKDLIGEENIEYKSDHVVLPTVCHNEDPSSASHKLYLYENLDSTPLFTCFTKCGDTFNIYSFIMRYFQVRNRKINFSQAYRMFHKTDFQAAEKSQSQEKTLEKINTKFINPATVKLPFYNPKVLEMFSCSTTDPWALEGVELEVLQNYQVSYSKSYEATIIPHFDWRGNLIGIRSRTVDKIKEKYAKYMPLKVGNKLYSHPLSMNLYGLFQNQENIANKKTIILAEGEKSVLQAESMLENNHVVAVCGSAISKWQKDMIAHYLQVERVIVAFDKEYKNFEEKYNYIQRIKNQLGYLVNFMETFVLIDEKNIFSPQESPFDRTIKDLYEMEMVKIK